jgi:LPS sulfotransferase NodH
MSRKFTIIAHARSGSTLLCRKLAELTEGRVFLEIFHHNLKAVRNHLGEDADTVCTHFLPLQDDALRDHLATHPLKLLDYLASLHPEKDLFFKIFPGHLQPPALNKVLGQSDGVIFLQRNLLHSFISSRIARRIQKWTTVDTSDQRITFEAQDFLQHLRQTTGFYTRAQNIAAKHGTPCVEITYEALARATSGDPELRAVLDTLSIPHGGGDAPSDTKLRRQDSRPLASDKVDNPAEMLHFLEGLGLEQANDGLVSLALGDFTNALNRAAT